MLRIKTIYLLLALAVLFLGARFYQGSASPSASTSLAEPLFNSTYPVHARFIEETAQMRSLNKLSPENENLIQVSTLNAVKTLGIPQSLLWCLMFQESRLNHLSGIKEGKLSTGIGQFSVSAFFELNHQLSRFISSPRSKVSSILGYDIRPLSSDIDNISSFNSYYFIPTAVTATALYLNNRWIQLARVAEDRGLAYSPDVLWAWASISYNKGGRSVLSIWNQIEKKTGTEGLNKALTSSDYFLATALDDRLVTQALSSIWSGRLLSSYKQELLTHVENIRDCALSPKTVFFKQEESP